MKLTELEAILIENGYQAKHTKINNDTTKQNRVYLDVDKKYQIYFADYENKPFLYVYINRPKGFDYANIRQTDEERKRCREAKYKLLKALKDDGITDIECYGDFEETLLYPIANKKKLEL